MKLKLQLVLLVLKEVLVDTNTWTMRKEMIIYQMHQNNIL